MLRSLFHPLFAAATLVLVVSGVTVWLRDADERGLAMLVPGVLCGFVATLLVPRSREEV